MKNFGVDVTIVEFLDRMVPTEDADVSKELAKHYKKLGVKVMLGTKVEAVEDTGSGVRVTVSPAAGGDQQVLEADKLLSAIGFAPRTEGYGLEPPASRSPSGAPSTSTSTAAPTSRACTPSVTAPPR
jgi:dihydrolipoamide dehydrogenase